MKVDNKVRRSGVILGILEGMKAEIMTQRKRGLNGRVSVLKDFNARYSVPRLLKDSGFQRDSCDYSLNLLVTTK